MHNHHDSTHHPILNRVLHAIRLNRVPGFHFPGYFLGLSYEQVAEKDSRVLLDAAHCADPDGQLNIGGLAVLADLAMAAAQRASVQRSLRLATVNMSLQFTGGDRRGEIEAVSTSDGFMQNISGCQGLSRVTLRNAAGTMCQGTASFMIMPPPQGMNLDPVPLPRRRMEPPAPLLRLDELSEDELRIVRHAEAVLMEGADQGRGFIARFFGYEPQRMEGGARCVLQNGPHVSNRVGHVQGGILLGLAAATASAALPDGWVTGAISACFLSPGEGEELQVESRIIHQGRKTAAVRTEISGLEGRRVLEALSSHACGPD